MPVKPSTSARAKLSTGIKHKFALAVALLHDPPILFLDEPLSNIDPITRREIKTLRKTEFSKKTIIWASHNLLEIDEICDRIVLVNNGKVMLDGTPIELKKQYLSHQRLEIVTQVADCFQDVQGAEVEGNSVQIKTANITETLREVVKIAKEKHVIIKSIRNLMPTLENVFTQGVTSNY